MTYLELHKELKVGQTITMVKKQGLHEDIYAEIGMIGVLTKIDIFDLDLDDTIILSIDWNINQDTNKEFESNGWYLKDGLTGTMKEAGEFPKDGIEEIHVMKNDEAHFTINK